MPVLVKSPRACTLWNSLGAGQQWWSWGGWEGLDPRLKETRWRGSVLGYFHFLESLECKPVREDKSLGKSTTEAHSLLLLVREVQVLSLWDSISETAKNSKQTRECGHPESLLYCIRALYMLINLCKHVGFEQLGLTDKEIQRLNLSCVGLHSWREAELG